MLLERSFGTHEFQDRIATELEPLMQGNLLSKVPAFQVVSKPTGPICNLNCKYCFYLEKESLYSAKSDWAMTEEMLSAFIRQYIESQKAPVVHFAWQGGEPTILGVAYFRKIVELQKKYAGGKKIENALQTNGTLLNDEWGEFLRSEHFLVGVSIDGPRELHDRYRVDKGNQPTFDRVIRGLDCLKAHGVEFNALTVVNRMNSYYPSEVYQFLKEAGCTVMQFIPAVEKLAVATPPSRGMSKQVVTGWSVEPLQYGRFLCRIFDEWVRKDVGQYFVQTFDVALESWIGIDQSLCIFHDNCGAALAIEHNGDVYSCDHFVTPPHKLGNILEQQLPGLLLSPQQQTFGANKRSSLPRYCRECDVLFACNGECPKNRFLRTPDGEHGLNYLCRGYKFFFRHVDPYMRFIAAQIRSRQPAADVMRWVRFRDEQMSKQTSPGRNESCSCGSERKFKKCCGRTSRSSSSVMRRH